MIEYGKTRYKDKFAFYKEDIVIGKSIRLYGEYSQLEVDFMLKLFTNETVVYDIGGNIGYHATAFASKVKQVYSFEPNPHNYTLLQQNTDGLTNVQLFKCAVGATNSTIKCIEFDPNVPGNFGSVQVGVPNATLEVPLVAIDGLGLEKPDFIKIDVEGSEYEVFKGCINTIKMHTPVIFYEAHETEHGKEIYEMLDILEYNMYWATVNNYNPNNFLQHKEDVFGNSALFSILAVPPGMPVSGFDKVLGPDDSFDKYFDRLRQRVAEYNKKLSESNK
jgi:FkbM family methyltransferase